MKLNATVLITGADRGIGLVFAKVAFARGACIALAKSTPEQVVARALDALDAWAEEVRADEVTQQVTLGRSAQPGV